MSCPGLETLTTIAPLRPSFPPRRIASFVPSNASTASTVPFFTTTVCPMSSRLDSFAIRNPNSRSVRWRGFRRGPARCPFPASCFSRNVVAGRSSTPAEASSAATAPKSVSAFRTFIRASSTSARKSGRRSKRFPGAIWPAMSAAFAPDFFAASRSFPSWPTRIGYASSASDGKSGEVSPSKMASEIRRTPAARAPAITWRG